MIQAALQALVPNAVPGMIPGVFPGVAPSALLTSGTLLDAHPVEVPGMCTGALSVISPTEVLPPTTESTPSTVTIKVIVRHSKACKDENPELGRITKTAIVVNTSTSTKTARTVQSQPRRAVGKRPSRWPRPKGTNVTRLSNG
jgi:hypothetical protein